MSKNCHLKLQVSPGYVIRHRPLSLSTLARFTHLNSCSAQHQQPTFFFLKNNIAPFRKLRGFAMV
jgi:hypothetical protein